VPVVAFALFVVVTQHAFAGHDECQPVFEPMRRPLRRMWNAPDDDFREGILGEDMTLMGQRLGLAVALLGDPPVLVLDEPSNGLDPEGIHWLRQFLRRLAADGRTVFVSSHLMAEMAVTADHLIVINKGRLVADTSTAEFIKRNSRNFVRVRTQEPEQFRRQLSEAGIAAVLAQDGSVEVSGVSAAEVNRLAVANHHVLDELSTQSASLEEAFLRLTNSTNETAR